jgi:NAD(P) transhydrogenase
MERDYDILVIGSGPAGQKAAIQAAKLDRRVGIVERDDMIGGVCTNTGTIPSKALREAVFYLSGMSQREIYGTSYRVKSNVTIGDLAERTDRVISQEINVIRHQLQRNHVDLLPGTARFVDPHTVHIAGDGVPDRQASAESIIVAVGTKPVRPANVAFNDRTVIDSDGLLHLETIPASLVVVGAGVIGVEYASMFAALGTKVTLVERNTRLLDFCDSEIVEGLQHHLRDLGVTFRLGETVVGVETPEGGTVTQLESGKRIPSEAVFYSAGRQGATEPLDLAAAGLEADARGRIVIGPDFRTSVPHIWAVGDVIGFPSLAATSMEQGRLAARSACGEPASETAGLLPFGIYAIPEISFVGPTEEELTATGTPYEVGISRYRELARGQILGDTHGMLKLLFSPTDRRLLAAHVLGTGATELIHLGQCAIALGGTIDYFIDAVFNYPTLAMAYKVAALDAANKIDALARLEV